MKDWMTAVLVALVIMLAAPAAFADYEVNIYAQDRNTGKPAPAGKYAWNIKVLTRAQWERLGSTERAKYNLKGTFCGVEYFFTQYHRKWMDAHGKYNHEWVIKERRPNGLVPICK